LKVSVCHSLSEVDESNWDSLGEADYPFTCHAFLYGLERHDCLEPFGWHPVYFLIHEESILIAALPCYIKTNSYGELVFDHAWSHAYERGGLDYYPKLVSAIPYTPATGERFLINHSIVCNEAEVQKYRFLLSSAVIDFCEQHHLSSWHILFAEAPVLEQFDGKTLMLRCDIQFHWQNHQYLSFEDFLARLSSRKRKNIRKERVAAHRHGLEIKMFEGHALDASEWSRIHELYASIYHRKYGTATLSEAFFQHLGTALGDRVLVVTARDTDKIVAAALYYRSDSHLYGRVWGSEDYAGGLHFECCYYQGIDYCIANKLEWFDPGAQGEHKLSRGFLPRKTWSGHWIRQPRFRTAIADFLKQEKQYIDDYQAQLTLHSPYRKAQI